MYKFSVYKNHILCWDIGNGKYSGIHENTLKTINLTTFFFSIPNDTLTRVFM